MDNIKKESFGERVFRLRNQLGYSQAQLAKKIGASHGSIQNYESNSLPKGEYAIKLAEVFNCTIDWLLTGKDPAYEKTINRGEKSNNNVTKVVIEHQDMVRRFKNPERAKAINQDLIEIEELSDELIDSIATHIKSSLNAAKIVKHGGRKKKQSEDQEDLSDRKSS